ncbi:uncharacterized protein LOC127748984 [Frankliniella occidentalis]|uniref:Uncharacterized protein LOC127748984 n=1 Tax=Frankliniella occidentalis TaxID=133901 RepID=A0A9C6TVP4_FRAOC|nr:uncharacterized protein LOC127748984 [Frankliniella occidentalis]
MWRGPVESNAATHVLIRGRVPQLSVRLAAVSSRLLSLRRGAVMMYALVALALLLPGGQGKAINSLAGPYTAYADRFYNCERKTAWAWYIRATHFNPLKPNELQLLTGNMTSERPVDDKCWLKVYLDTRSNNQWKENAFIFEFRDKACNTLQVHTPGFYNVFFGKEKKPKGAPCSIGPGVFSVVETPIDWTFPKFLIMPYGNYKFRMTVGVGKEMVACLIVECHVIPKVQT